jgi:hypothetical protein
VSEIALALAHKFIDQALGDADAHKPPIISVAPSGMILTA